VNPLPLHGKTILVTRARHQAGQLSAELRKLGASVLEIPAIEIVPPKSFAELDAALLHLSQFQWLILTSANAVEAVSARIESLGLNLAALTPFKIAAVGSATAEAIRKLGLEVAVTPPEYVAESLAAALADRVRGQRVLLARAAVARDVIPDALRTHGAVVEVVDAYRTVIPAASVTEIRTLFSTTGAIPDAATFTSSSTVTNFLNLLREAGVQSLKTLLAVSIGPITSQTLRENGFSAAAEADPHNLAGLVDAVVRAVSGWPGAGS
jgi:uroporphyrinogen-III synthase